MLGAQAGMSSKANEFDICQRLTYHVLKHLTWRNH